MSITKTDKGEAETTEFTEWNRQTDEEKFYESLEREVLSCK